MKTQAIILTAGIGKRFNSENPKTLALLNNKPLLWYSLKAFDQCLEIDSLIIVVDPNKKQLFNSVINSFSLSKKKSKLSKHC